MTKKELEELVKSLLAANRRLEEENEKLVGELAQQKRTCPPLVKDTFVVTGAEPVAAYFMAKIGNEKKEYFYTLLLDTKHRIIREDLVSIGCLNMSIVHPREVFAPAIRESAESILLVHNHPSGDPTPSNEDRSITRQLREVGCLVGIAVLDHIIVGRDKWLSFVSEGY